MTGSALSLYLEETKTTEDSMFQSAVTPIKKEEPKNGKRSMSAGSSNVSKRDGAKVEVSNGLSPTALELHKVDVTGVHLMLPNQYL